MANSFTYGAVDFSTYGLVVKDRDIPMSHTVDSVQLHYRQSATDSRIGPKTITLNVVVTAASVTTLKTNMDTIKRLLNTQVDTNLILDSLDDRYWVSRFDDIRGSYKGIKWEGRLDFICLDPYAYDNTETDDDYTDNEDPETITHTAGGTALIEPVWTLTATGNQPGITILLNNTTLGMELQWAGDMLDTEILIIDSSEWTVTLEGAASMSGVSGVFPLLSPGVANTITVHDFTGNVNITYRNRYN